MWSFFRRSPTWADLVADYFASPTFLALSTASQRPYRRVIECWLRDEGLAGRPVRGLCRVEIEQMMARRSPGAANDLLKKLRILLRFAIGRGMRRDDPTLGIRRYPAGRGHHSWTEAEIAQFEHRWPVGTRERLAFALLLYTGQRRADVARMGWPEGNPPRISVRQGKTGTALVIPLHPALTLVLAAQGEPGPGPILLTARSEPFSPAGFGLWMADKIEAAGLPERCVTHGLRKAAARRLAEAGCSAHEIAAITGHRTLREVERYTQAARQERLAASALRALERVAHQ